MRAKRSTCSSCLRNTGKVIGIIKGEKKEAVMMCKSCGKRWVPKHEKVCWTTGKSKSELRGGGSV